MKKIKKAASKKKSIFRIAGEAIGTLGHDIVEGGEKLAELSQTALHKITGDAKTVKKAAKKKSTSLKKAAKKVVKKAAKKTIKKAIKKAVKKAVTPARKAMKKSAAKKKK